MRQIVKIVALSLVLGCGGAAAQRAGHGGRPAQDPSNAGAGTAVASPPGAARDPFALPPRPSETDLFTLAASDTAAVDAGPLLATDKRGVAPRPKACSAYETRAPAAADGFAAALSENDPGKRDAMLVGLRAKAPLLVAALRADLAPVECADAITDKELTDARKTPLAGSSASVVLALSVASKLARTGAAPPSMQDTSDKEKVKAFIRGPLAKWVVEQAKAIELLSDAAAGLRGYARGLAAVEAGVADLRLVDNIRNAPTPKSWDRELKAVYEIALDEALEPRKRRGRDAALVGLADLAHVGVLKDASVAAARALLAKLYGGRRIDALDALLLPPWSAPAAAVPVYWVAAAPELGLAREAGAAGVAGRIACNGAACADYARARFEMGRTYWRRVDFIEAAHAAKEVGADPNARLLLALSLALANGPNGAKEMMGAPSPSALGLDHTDALDALAGEGGPASAMAAFNAAHLRSLSVPEGDAAPAYLRDVATRFKKSAALFADAAQRKLAEQRADEAEAAAAALDKKP